MRRLALLRLLLWGLTCSLVLVCFTPRAEAQPTGLPAVIDVDDSGLDAAAIQAAIEHELGVRLLIDPTARDRLEVALSGRRANVTYNASGREPVTRSVDLPRDPQRALETIAFLAGNLARDEASELLAQLAPPPGTEPESVPRPEPPKPPPPAPPPPPTASPATPALIEPNGVAANASVSYPLTALKHTEQRRLNIELGILYSRVGAIHGAGMTLGYFRSDGLVEGYSAALGWNRSGPVKGVQFAALGCEGSGELHGITFATFVDLRDGDTHGIQGSAIFARTKLIFGIQASAIAAVAGEVQGLQGGVIASVAGPVQGGQVGLVNVAGPLHGLELGLVNVSRPVEGTQIGFVNVAGSVHGFQLGFVNVADEIHGGALGVVSIAKNGRLQPTTWLSGPVETLFVGLKSVTDLTYSMFGVGYDLTSGSSSGAYHLGHQESFGAHLELGHHFFLEPGIGYGATYKNGDFTKSGVVRTEVRFDARAGFEPIHGVTPFVGGSLTRRVQGHGADFRGEFSFGVALL
jgi:hypothetical protein